jgi:NAD-dependent dihydropyrimidine dehydrogenase PreA subunit
MLEILERITEGKGEADDIEKLETLAKNIRNSALCGLGQTAPNPVLSTLRYFRDEYEAHINEKRCPAGVCQGLLNYKVVEDKCKGCGICAKQCPVSCISGQLKGIYNIDSSKCI